MNGFFNSIFQQIRTPCPCQLSQVYFCDDVGNAEKKRGREGGREGSLRIVPAPPAAPAAVAATAEEERRSALAAADTLTPLAKNIFAQN